MECIECETTVERPTLVTFITGKLEQLPLCAECAAEYEEGAFVESVADGAPATGGEPQQIAKCSSCGKVYPAQLTSGGGLRPVGLEAGSCVCGNTEFRPVVEQ